MLENTVKGLVYSLSNFTMVDKKTGEEKGMINIHFIYQTPNEDATHIGWQESQSWFTFNDDLWKGLKSVVLKNADLTYRLVPDFKDSTKYTAKLIKVNDIVIKQ